MEDPFLSRRSLLHLLGEVGTGLELHYLLGSDFDLLAGLWVASLAGSTLGDAEGAEADEGNAVTFLQGLGGVVHEGIQGALGIGLGNFGFSGHRFDQFSFVQTHVRLVLSVGLFSVLVANVSVKPLLSRVSEAMAGKC